MENFTEAELEKELEDYMDISFWLDEQIYISQEDFYEDCLSHKVTTYDNFIYYLKMHMLFCYMIIYKDKIGTSLKQQIDCHWNYYINEYKKN